MHIIEIKERDSALMERLLNVWESSVRATHLFLSENEIENIKRYVPQALREVPHLITAENENKLPVGFMGIDGQHLEMLFIADEERGKGIGKKLLSLLLSCMQERDYKQVSLSVQKQNPAVRLY